MAYPVPETETPDWKDDPVCEHCGHDLVWANADGRCTYVEDGVRCTCTIHAH